MSQSYACFIDSNLWLYAMTQQAPPLKTTRARELITAHANIVISTQVINEVCVNLLKKAGFTEAELRTLADDFYQQYTVVEIGQAIIRQASLIRERHKFSFWDSLIVASAQAGGATVLFSEDMQDGFTIENLMITNPFHTA